MQKLKLNMLLAIETFQLHQHHMLMKQRYLWDLFYIKDTTHQFNSLRFVSAHCKRIVSKSFWSVERVLLFLKPLVVVSNQFDYLPYTSPCYWSEFVFIRDTILPLVLIRILFNLINTCFNLCNEQHIMVIFDLLTQYVH